MRKIYRLFAPLLFFCASTQTRADDVSNRAIFIGNAAHKITSTQSWGYVNGMATLIDAYRADPKLPLEKVAIQIKSRIDVEPQKFRDDVEFANMIYEAIKGGGAGGHVAGTALQYVLKKVVENKSPETIHSENVANYFSYKTGSGQLANVLSEVYEISQKDDNFKRAFNIIFAAPLGANLEDRSEIILKNNPNFATLQYVKDLTDDEGNLKVSIQDAQKKLQADLKEQASAIKNVSEDVKKGTQLQNEIMVNGPSSQILSIMKKQAEATKQSEQEQVKQQSLRAGVMLIGSLIQDRGESKRFLAAGTSILDVNEAVRKFENNVRLMQDNSFGMLMSATILSGNLLSIGMSLANAFGEAGPTTDQIILDSLRQISEQLASFQAENRARFDQIDTNMNTIYNSMIEGFDQLTKGIGGIQKEIAQAHTTIAVTLTRLNRIETQLNNYLSLIADSAYRRDLNYCIDYAEKHGGVLSKEKYDECVSSIETFLSEASSLAHTGIWKHNFDSIDLANLFEDEDWNAKINTFRQMAAAWSGYTLTEEKIANPIRWADAASSYVKLAVQNENHFFRSPTLVLDKLYDEGVKIDTEFTKKLIADRPDKFLDLLAKILTMVEKAALEIKSEAIKVHQNTLNSKGWAAYYYTLKGKKLIIGDGYGKIYNKNVSSLKEPSWGQKVEKSLNYLDVKATKKRFYEDSYKDFEPKSSSNWPAITGDRTRNIWNAMLQNDAMADIVYFSGKEIIAEYEFNWKNPVWHAADGSLQDLIWSAPSMTFFYYLNGDEGKRRLLAVGNSFENNKVLAHSKKFKAHTQLGLYPPFDAKQYVLNAAYPVITLTAKDEPKGSERDIIHDGASSELLLALLNAANDKTSGLYRAIEQANGAVKALRGLVALTMPSKLNSDDFLRTLLYGTAQQWPCRRSQSRIVKKNNGGEEIAYEEREEFKKRDKNSDEEFCAPGSEQEVSAAHINNLPSREAVLSLMLSGFSEGKPSGLYISEASLLLSMDLISKSVSEKLLEYAYAATQEAVRNPDHNRFVKAHLERLRALKTSHP